MHHLHLREPSNVQLHPSTSTDGSPRRHFRSTETRARARACSRIGQPRLRSCQPRCTHVSRSFSRATCVASWRVRRACETVEVLAELPSTACESLPLCPNIVHLLLGSCHLIACHGSCCRQEIGKRATSDVLHVHAPRCRVRSTYLPVRETYVLACSRASSMAWWKAHAWPWQLPNLRRSRCTCTSTFVRTNQTIRTDDESACEEVGQQRNHETDQREGSCDVCKCNVEGVGKGEGRCARPCRYVA